MWSVVAYSMRHQLYYNSADAHSTKHFIKRRDGGEYVAIGYVNSDFEVSYDKEKYRVPNNMTRWSDAYKLYSWQISSYYDSRTNDSNDNKGEDYDYLYEYITGKITKSPVYAYQFKRLFDKGYLAAKGDSEYVNIIVTTNSKDEFESLLPGMTDELKKAGEELDKEIFAFEKAQIPAHMHDLHRAWTSNCLSDQDMIAYVYDLLIDDGTLKPLTDAQKLSVNTIMSCDTLPE
jgi:hypothetical protein